MRFTSPMRAINSIRKRETSRSPVRTAVDRRTKGNTEMFRPVACAPTVTADPRLETARLELAQEVARDITHKVIPENPDGFTYDPIGLYLPSFHSDVFLVSLQKYGMLADQPPSEPLLFLWVLRWFDLLARPCHYIGGWFSAQEGLYYLDISIPVRTEEAALRVAAEQEQSTIYHPATGRVISVPQALPIPHRPAA